MMIQMMNGYGFQLLVILLVQNGGVVLVSQVVKVVEFRV
jgi:hypothetical protein